MDNKENTELVVVAKTNWMFKILNPIVAAVALPLLILILIIADDVIIRVMFSVIVGMLSVVLILSLACPIKAVVHDKQNDRLIIRAAKTLFTVFKRRYVNIDDIENVYYKDITGFNADGGLYLVLNGKTMALRTIGAPAAAAEKINLLRAELQMRQERERRNNSNLAQ